MIKISKYIYIHPLTIFMFAISYVTRTLGTLSLLYLVMLLHELSHMCAAIFLKLGVSRIILYPFGVSLTVKARILCSLSDKIILYLSGPFINAIIAFVMAVMGIRNDFYYNNLALFILNLLPILPLDGGRLLEEILLSRKGERFARKIMMIISCLTSVFAAAVVLIFTRLNINSLSFALFILGGMFMQKPKYNRDYVRQLALSGKKSPKARVILAESDDTPQKLIKEFSPSERTLVVFCSDDGSIDRIKTDREVIYNILT